MTPNAVLGGVLGSLEGLHDLMLAVGSIAVPILIALVGSRGAIILTGLWLPIIVLATWRLVVEADAHAIVHVRELDRLRALPMFAPLPPPTIEWMAAHLRELDVEAGTAVIREGQVGDRFYVIDRGACEVAIADRTIRRLGPGDAFGEIALAAASAANRIGLGNRADLAPDARPPVVPARGHRTRRARGWPRTTWSSGIWRRMPPRPMPRRAPASAPGIDA